MKDNLSRSELDAYLDEKLYPTQVNETKDDFNILNYWKSVQTKFPIMSIMVKDILAILVSSVVFERAFSIGGSFENDHEKFELLNVASITCVVHKSVPISNSEKPVSMAWILVLAWCKYHNILLLFDFIN
ncbi:HAT, C-terminal dimerization domain, partial [Dillenia turbinata]